MTTDRAYAAARQLIDPDADYAVHVRTGTGWKQPGDADQRELPGLDVLLATRRVLRAQPAGRVWSVRPDTLNLRTGDGRVWLRVVVTTLAQSDLCDTADCAAFLTDDGSCTRCSPGSAPDRVKLRAGRHGGGRHAVAQRDSDRGPSRLRAAP